MSNKNSSQATLALEGLSKHFGGMTVLSDIGLQVAHGQIHGLIGPNGAGKTTLINVATGYYAPDCGSVRIQGTDVTHTAPAERACLGLARTFQGARPFGRLDVRTNLRLAVEQRGDVAAIDDPVRWRCGAGQLRDGRQKIERRGYLVARRASRNATGRAPPC